MEPKKCAKGFPESFVMLMKDKKIISRVECVNLPITLPSAWNVTKIVREQKLESLTGIPSFCIYPACEDKHQEREWGIFLEFLRKHNRVAVMELGLYDVYIPPPTAESNLDFVTGHYNAMSRRMGPQNECIGSEVCRPLAGETVTSNTDLSLPEKTEVVFNSSSDNMAKVKSAQSSRSSERNAVIVHPSYLETLGQAHSSWMFGAIAELVDNSRDAKANKLEVTISMVYSKTANEEVPMLGVVDDGVGMCHSEVQRMVKFGHGQTESYDANHIGKYGIGFKTGAMRLGKDVLVLTQTTNSRSIAFLSQSLNEGKDNLEIPIVSYRRFGQSMKLDIEVQDEDSANLNLKLIKKFSPFDKYLIGEKSGLFNEYGTGTQIYIWNLDKWGSDYSLEWITGTSEGTSFDLGNIFIRSKRIRSRTGQISQTVPLDFNLKAYLGVIFLDPRMKIYVQGALVNSRPLAKSLNQTVVETGVILQKPVELILGRSQLEWEQMNCGIFLYWHGRLIEAYKRVGSMVHDVDKGRGIVGVIDVTSIMDESNGHVWVHNNKQGFQDCEAYAELEKWLGKIADAYLDKYIDNVKVRKGNASYKPDQDWVQCDKCRKWRTIDPSFDSTKLPMEWFCYMKPFNGKCSTQEEKVKSGVITISTKRHGAKSKDIKQTRAKSSESEASESGDSDESSSAVDSIDVSRSKKRKRICLPRSCKKENSSKHAS